LQKPLTGWLSNIHDIGAKREMRLILEEISKNNVFRLALSRNVGAEAGIPKN
jgi:hypothetical protein